MMIVEITEKGANKPVWIGNRRVTQGERVEMITPVGRLMVARGFAVEVTFSPPAPSPRPSPSRERGRERGVKPKAEERG